MPQSNARDFMANKCDAEEAVEFLKSLWGLYTTPQCYSIVMLAPSVVATHYCGNAHDVLKEVQDYLSSLRACSDIYFQVLPLSERPKSGRGAASLVKTALWAFADLDYKEIVSDAPFEGCVEGEDHSLTCYYRDGDKVVRVNRPALSEVLEDIRTKVGVEPTMVVDSGAGYHVYYQLPGETPINEWRQVEEHLVKLLGGDPQARDPARIMRLPGTVNSRVNRQCKVIHTSDSVLHPDDLIAQPLRQDSKLLPEVPKTTAIALSQPLRELNDTDILKIVEALKDAYTPGYRQALLLYLSGWLAKAGISPISACKIARYLHQASGDSDPIKTRLATVAYSYRKVGVDLTPYAQTIEELAGVKPYGLEGEVSITNVKGYSGLQEVLEATIGAERALGTLHMISEIVGSTSPYQDSIVEIIEDDKRLVAIADLRRKMMFRGMITDNGIRYKERVAVAVPTEVIVYDNPLGGITRYEVVFESPIRKRPLRVMATVEEIADRLVAEGLVYHPKLIKETLFAILSAFILKGRAKEVADVDAPGFYLLNNKLVSVKVELKDINKVELTQALTLLNELAEVWFKHAQAKFATVVKWGSVAPFMYVMKQRGKLTPWLYLFGDSATGKTTLGRIVLKMWGLDSRYEKSGGNIDTLPRLGHILSQSTFPTLVNEPGGALTKEDVIEAIKHACENTITRGRFVRGTYSEIPALSPLIITSNKVLPVDDALTRRFIVITFSFGEKVPADKQVEFREKVKLEALAPIGNCIAQVVLGEGLPDGTDVLSIGERLLARCYELAEMPVPSWLALRYEDEEDPVTDVIELFAARFRRYINDAYARYISKMTVERPSEEFESVIPREDVTLEDKLVALLKHHMLEYVALREDKRVVIKAGLLKELGIPDTLKSLAEKLGWEYKVVEVAGRSWKGAVVPLDELVRFLKVVG